MRLPMRIRRWLCNRLIYAAIGREPDFIVGGAQNPYLKRWFVLPWSHWCHRWRRQPEQEWTLWQRFVMRWPVIYLHQFLRSDDDRALHDHPWANCSVLLSGRYAEHTIAAGGVHRRKVRGAGDVAFRLASVAHRVELLPEPVYTYGVRSFAGSPPLLGPCWSLFITWFRLREWGFHCPERGWVHWREFTQASDRGAVGKGCDA